MGKEKEFLCHSLKNNEMWTIDRMNNLAAGGYGQDYSVSQLEQGSVWIFRYEETLGEPVTLNRQSAVKAVGRSGLTGPTFYRLVCVIKITHQSPLSLVL